MSFRVLLAVGVIAAVALFRCADPCPDTCAEICAGRPEPKVPLSCPTVSCFCSDPTPDPRDGGATDGGATDAGAGDAGTLLVSYSFGNQISGSTLEIDRDGGVTHSERTCCPPTTVPVAQPPLAPSVLGALGGFILEARGAAIQTELLDGGAGASSGFLIAFLPDGAPVVVRRLTLQGPALESERNTAPDAGAIRAVVVGYTSQDIPP